MFQRPSGSPERGPYDGLDPDELILRDLLAADRTALANERTLLAYIRTALAFALAGASVWHFLVSTGTDVLGAVLIVCAVGAAATGVARYRQIRRRIARLEASAGRLAAQGRLDADED